MREAPYITIEAEAPLDPRWTPQLWFAWSRLLGTCRLKRACTAETWPAAVLHVRIIQAASILGVYPNQVRSTLDRLKMVASISVESKRDHGGHLLSISVDNYAKYQKLGRPTSARSSAELSDPPHVPTSLRSKREDSEAAAEPAAARRSPLRNALRRDLVDPPATDAEVDAWLAAIEPECIAAADAELPDSATSKQRGAAVLRIALARWRTYLRSERAFRDGRLERAPPLLARRMQERADVLSDVVQQALELGRQREQGTAGNGGVGEDVRRLRANADA